MKLNPGDIFIQSKGPGIFKNQLIMLIRPTKFDGWWLCTSSLEPTLILYTEYALRTMFEKVEKK
jgi:hypothetical protein